MSARRCCLMSYKRNAVRRSILWELSDTDAFELFKKDCSYCGIGPARVSQRSITDGPYVSNGLDRVNNAEGYTLSNTVACCTDCNRSKSTLSPAEFKSFIVRAYEHLNSLNKQISASEVSSV